MIHLKGFNEISSIMLLTRVGARFVDRNTYGEPANHVDVARGRCLKVKVIRRERYSTHCQDTRTPQLSQLTTSCLVILITPGLVRYVSRLQTDQVDRSKHADMYYLIPWN